MLTFKSSKGVFVWTLWKSTLFSDDKKLPSVLENLFFPDKRGFFLEVSLGNCFLGNQSKFISPFCLKSLRLGLKSSQSAINPGYKNFFYFTLNEQSSWNVGGFFWESIKNFFRLGAGKCTTVFYQEIIKIFFRAVNFCLFGLAAGKI